MLGGGGPMARARTLPITRDDSNKTLKRPLGSPPLPRGLALVREAQKMEIETIPPMDSCGWTAMRHLWTRGLGRQSIGSAPRNLGARSQPWRYGQQSIRFIRDADARHLPHRFSPTPLSLSRGAGTMADQHDGESNTEFRLATPEALLNRLMITMLIMENPDEITDLVYPILKRFLGMSEMTIEERALCEFFNDCANSREDDGLD